MAPSATTFDVNANIRATVRALAGYRGIETLDVLAKAIGISTSTMYSRMKKDRTSKDATDFTADEVFRLAEFFNVKTNVFYELPPEDYRGVTGENLVGSLAA